MKVALRSLLLPLLLSPLLAPAATPAPPGAEVYFISPRDGETVSSPVTVRFGLKGMGVAPAGTQKDAPGHPPLLIYAPLPPLDQPVPNAEHH